MNGDKLLLSSDSHTFFYALSPHTKHTKHSSMGGDSMPLFGRKEEGKVPLNNDVMMKCMCGMCPVQAESACSRPKIKSMMDMRGSMGMKGSGMPGMSMSLAQSPMGEQETKPEEMPGPFCSIGVE